MPRINIDGKYPCMANWVILRRSKDGIIARNCLTDEVIKLSEREAKYLIRLNGNRNHYRVKGFSYDECMEYYKHLNSNLLIRNSGRNISLGKMNIHTLIIPSKHRTNSVIPKIVNLLLWISFLPIFIYGFYRIFTYGIIWGMQNNVVLNFLLGNIGGIVLGVISHETAHAIACLSDRNGRFIEAGIMKRNGIIPGAYVLIDDIDIKSRLKKLQINLAGIEMNLLLSGVIMILMTSEGFLDKWKIAMLYAMIHNILQALINIIPVHGLDGEQVISTLLDVSVVDAAKVNNFLLFDIKRRKKCKNLNKDEKEIYDYE